MSLHADKLRWLAWLRVKMLLRNFQRNPRTTILTIIGLLVLLFVAVQIAGALLFAFNGNMLSNVGTTEVLYLLFSGLLLFWIALPLLSYSTNEGLDVTRLQLFPLTRLELMFSLLFSSLFDIWTVLLFVLFGATVLAWWMHSLALGLLTLLVIVVFYFVMVGCSQLVLALLMRTLQSRRFRDLSVIILALFGSSCYLFNRFALGANTILNIGNGLNSGSFSPYLQWLPSGVAASAIRAASQGHWTTSFIMLGLLLAIGALALYLWQLVLERSMTASEAGASRRSKQRQQAALAAPSTLTATPTTRPAGKQVSAARAIAPARENADPLRANIFEQLQALVRKEFICFWRDPQLKVRMFQILFYMLIVVVVPAFSASNGTNNASEGFYARYTPFASVAVILLFMLTLSLNTLGIERQSLTTLFLFPIERRRLLWGKNLAVFLLGLVVLVALMIFCVVTSREPAMVLPAIIIGFAGMGVALACGNMTSAYFPRYQRSVGQRGYAATGGQAQSGGCLNQLMALIMLVVSVLLLSPVALGIGLPFFMNMQVLWLVTMPLSLAYGLALYIIFTNLAAKRILATEPEILLTTTRE